MTLSGGTWSPVARTPQRGLARGQLRGHWCGKGSGVASLGGHVRGSSPLLVYKGCWCCCYHALEKEMATHSSVLAWRIPGMGSSRVATCISWRLLSGLKGVRPRLEGKPRTPLSSRTTPLLQRSKHYIEGLNKMSQEAAAGVGPGDRKSVV